MPEQFILECLTSEGEWIDHGVYDAMAFERTQEGAYLCSGSGSPMYLRCVRQDGCVLYVLDGGFQPYTYRMVPFPGEGPSGL